MQRITENRRVTPRNLIDCPVQLQPLGSVITASSDAPSEHAEAAPCIVQDVSASGAQIWADRQFAVGERLELTFDCTRTGLEGKTTCRITVVWANAEPVEGRWQIGVRFHEDDENARRISAALYCGCGWCERLCPEIAEPQTSTDVVAREKAD